MANWSLFNFIVILFFGLLILVGGFAFIGGICSFKLSKKYEEKDEELFQKYAEERNKEHKIGVLSDLENQTLEKLLQMFEEDKVNFIINDGRVVDYEFE